MKFRKRNKNKKFIILGIFIFLLFAVGIYVCLRLTVFRVARPSEVVENYLNGYNSLEKDITSEIKYEFEDKLDKKQKKKYESIMKKQYQKMFYSILEEEVTDNKAIIKAEVTVTDFNTCYNDADNHIGTHPDKFLTVERQIDYKLNKLDTCSEKVTYPLTFNLRKSVNEWLLDNLTEADLKKIRGTY